MASDGLVLCHPVYKMKRQIGYTSQQRLLTTILRRSSSRFRHWCWPDLHHDSGIGNELTPGLFPGLTRSSSSHCARERACSSTAKADLTVVETTPALLLYMSQRWLWVNHKPHPVYATITLVYCGSIW